jgi:hypothetical protein
MIRLANSPTAAGEAISGLLEPTFGGFGDLGGEFVSSDDFGSLGEFGSRGAGGPGGFTAGGLICGPIGVRTDKWHHNCSYHDSLDLPAPVTVIN